MTLKECAQYLIDSSKSRIIVALPQGIKVELYLGLTPGKKKVIGTKVLNLNGNYGLVQFKINDGIVSEYRSDKWQVVEE